MTVTGPGPDAVLAALKAPKPTLTASRTARADLHLLASAGARQHRFAQHDAVLPEGFSPSSSLTLSLKHHHRRNGHGSQGSLSLSRSLGDISKSASNLRKKVLRPLSRYLA